MNEGSRTLAVGGCVIAALGVGWFALSHVVMETSIPDAIGESLGFVLALLILVSVVGAVVSGRGKPG